MKSLWNDEEAARFESDLGLRVYTSRLLGREPALVLHGGGNTSVKLRERNLLGEEDVLYIKGSGWDLETIEEEGFSPVRQNHMIALSRLKLLSDPEMVNELRTHMLRASAPTPSIETILHAILPFKYVDHTHADAVVTLTNTPHGEGRIREAYGDTVVIIPYTMPGFELARLCGERFPREASDHTMGMVLLNHGIFSFGQNARESYERMIELVTRAEHYLAKHGAWDLPRVVTSVSERPLAREIADLRAQVSKMAGRPMIVATDRSARVMSFVHRDDLATISQQGPATPDHIIRTKRIPQLGKRVADYAAAYRQYFEAHQPDAGRPLTMLDPAPRVILDKDLGMCTVGRTAQDAAVVGDIYRHTMDVIERATMLSQYQALSSESLFEVEYWDLEQAKLQRGGPPPVLSGEVAVVTGAASGIGRACVASLHARGAAVVGLDIDAAIAHMPEYVGDPGVVGIECDVTQPQQVSAAVEQAVRRFGGLDMLILNAGIFPSSCPIDALSLEDWHRVMAINLDANLIMMRDSFGFLQHAPRGGRVVIVGSKNIPAPGPGVAAYSASKAALHQLGRVAALEWGGDNIRVNTIHPNAVFDTGLWTEEVLASRAAQYEVSVEEYKRRNVLRVPVAAKDVAELAAEMCGPLFAKTTGAQVPVDGGNDRII